MKRRSPQPDYYALLQVAPHASAEEIAAAYADVRTRYSAERTADAAPELQALAAEKLKQFETAYAVLSDAQQRAAYDQQYDFVARHGAASSPEPTLDYRPLPPARGQERSSMPEPALAPAASERWQRVGVGSWLTPIIVAVLGVALLLLLILSGVQTTSGVAALATPTIPGVELPFTTAQLKQFRAAAETSNTAFTWAALGNAIFDNLQTLRENAPQSPQYRSQLQSWLDAVQSYDRSLALADNVAVRSSRAVALMNYGLDAPDPARVKEAVAEVERGSKAGTTDPRVLLNYGVVLLQTNPPRIDEALTQWRKIVAIAPKSPEAQSAQSLLQRYGQP